MSRTLKGVLALMLVGLSTGLMGFVGDVTQVTEPQLESAIRERLAADSRIDAKNIQVKVDQGVVTLSGTVPDFDSKVLAEALVSGTIVGVRQLRNEITVVRAVVKDEEIRKSVEAALRSVPALRESKLNRIIVMVHEGDVVHKGTVEKPLYGRLARKIAQTVPGVVSIDPPPVIRPPLEFSHAERPLIGATVSGAGGRYPSALCGRCVLY